MKWWIRSGADREAEGKLRAWRDSVTHCNEVRPRRWSGIALAACVGWRKSA